jgi:cytidine deaminase
LIVQVEQRIPFPMPERTFFDEAARACLRLQGINAPCLINLVLTDDPDIREVNHTWRGIDSPTDVLSFPCLSLTPNRLFDPSAPGAQAAWDSDANAFFLGDILLNIPQAMRQAAQLNNTIRREIIYLFVHGVFHLMGYDHITKEDQQRMRNLEEQSLEATSPAPVSDEQLLDLARAAREFAHTPYSNYKVGAALLARDGTVYTGCNIENASYGLTNCAERTAVFKAVSEGNAAFDTIAIAADRTAPWPCGACRQVLSEFAPKLRVLISWGEGQTDSSTLDQLLPHSFLSFQEDTHG